MQLRQRIKDTDKAIEAAVGTHPQAAIMRSLPGMGPLVAAEFTVAVGDLSTFPSADHLAAYAGLAPIPRDSGKRTGNLHRPQRYNRRLCRVFYMSALTTLKTNGPNRTYYQRKRAEGRKHQQALIALARRRVDVLWALLRDNRPFQPDPPIPQPAWPPATPPRQLVQRGAPPGPGGRGPAERSWRDGMAVPEEGGRFSPWLGLRPGRSAILPSTDRCTGSAALLWRIATGIASHVRLAGAGADGEQRQAPNGA